MPDLRQGDILYVNFEYPPTGGPGIWRALAFTRYLAESGYTVTVLCSDRAIWHDRRDETLLQRVPASVRVVRIASIFRNDIAAWLERRRAAAASAIGRAVWQRLGWLLPTFYPEQVFLWMVKAVMRGASIALRSRPVCIVTSGPPHVSHAVGLLLHRAMRVPWIMDYRDLWTDDTIQTPRGPYQRRLFVWMERLCRRTASAVVVVSPSWLKLLVERRAPAVAADRFHLILNGHDLEPSTLQAGGSPADGRTRVHVHFSGTIQAKAHPLDALFEALRDLKTRNAGRRPLPLVTFTGIGEPQMQRIRAAGIADIVQDVGAMSHAASVEYSLQSDVLLVMLKSFPPASRGTIPAKIYEGMALGKRILGILPRENDAADLLREYGHADLCDSDSVDSIRSAFESLQQEFADTGRVAGAPPEARARVFARFSRRSQAGQLAGIIDSLVTAEGAATTRA